MPQTRKGESRKAWMKRCVPVLLDEGREGDQAVAICSSMFARRNKKKK